MASGPRPEREPVDPPARRIRFAGLDWWVKSSATPVGPGPNVFSDALDNVRVGDDGALRLAITEHSGTWRCAEIVCSSSLGYGTYQWVVDGEATALAPEVVLGLFTWSDEPAYAHRELDIELTRWSDPVGRSAWYAIHRPGRPDDPLTHGFHLGRGSIGEHQFTWAPRSVAFRTTTAAGTHRWGYDGPEVPVPGGENPRINLWLHRGGAPGSGTRTIVVRRFTFVPLRGSEGG